ncbi:MAG TPA: hypothetical protein PLK08_08695 [Phycisphaerae bacterium]|nr:hypothetical protein [Phycisphaerae bacterium]
MIFTVTETPWTSCELADIHGTSAGRAKEQQTKIDDWILKIIAREYVAAGTRSDQAANSIRCRIARLNKLFTKSPQRAMQHVTRLITIAKESRR